MLGLYFSGTGNTAHCVSAFVKQCDAEGPSLSIEDADAPAQIKAHRTLVLGCPVYFSNAPKIMQDFIDANSAAFPGKEVFLIATMGLFSGDGTGCMARRLQKCGARILGGLHLKMPDCIGDEKPLKRSAADNRALIAAADAKLCVAAQKLLAGSPPREGLGLLPHLAGLFGQRLWLYDKTAKYQQNPTVDAHKCTGCGLCARLCPMQNLQIMDGRAVAGNRCTLCYRCFSHCPAQALTILGKQVHEQYLFENT